MQAAVGCAQLEKFPSFVERRKYNFKYLQEKLIEAGAEEGLILPRATKNSDPSWFGFLMTCKEGIDREQVVRYIEGHGVQTRMLFAGNLTKHPCFDQMRAEQAAGADCYRVIGDLANTERIMKDSFWVGLYPGMTDAKLDYMAKTIAEAVKQ